jgi:hypothetical protein
MCTKRTAALPLPRVSVAVTHQGYKWITACLPRVVLPCHLSSLLPAPGARSSVCAVAQPSLPFFQGGNAHPRPWPVVDGRNYCSSRCGPAGRISARATLHIQCPDSRVCSATSRTAGWCAWRGGVWCFVIGVVTHTKRGRNTRERSGAGGKRKRRATTKGPTTTEAMLM